MINRHCKQKYSIEYGYISVVDGVDECFICLSKDCGFRLKNYSVSIFVWRLKEYNFSE